MTTDAGSSGAKGMAKKAIAPLERRLEMAVTRAVEVAMRNESQRLQEALRADVATLVELTYELQRKVDELTAATHPLDEP